MKKQNTNKQFDPESEDDLSDGHYDSGFNFDEPSPFPVDGTPSVDVTSFHSKSDLDFSQFSQHHSLGIRHTQASPGDHSHDGGTSKDLGAWIDMPIAWSSGGTQPAIGNGTLKCRIQKLGTTVRVRVVFVPNTGTTFGTGSWTFTMGSTTVPFPPAKANYGGTLDGFIGLAQALSGSGFSTISLGILSHHIFDGTTAFRIVSPGVAQIWNATTPITWTAATTNGFTAQWDYESVS